MTARDVTIAGLSAVIDRRYRGSSGINVSVTDNWASALTAVYSLRLLDRSCYVLAKTDAFDLFDQSRPLQVQ
jgi:hypothetical protein